MRRKARQFLDEEAELSEEDDGADVSSDEEDGEEEDHSLGGFVVDNTHCSQGLNGTNIMVLPRHGFNGSSVECLSSGRLTVLCCNVYIWASCPLSVRIGDAWCLPEVSEKPCSPGQVQNVLQKSSQHGHIFTGILPPAFLYSMQIKT